MSTLFFIYSVSKSWQNLNTSHVYPFSLTCWCFCDIAIVAYLVYWTPNVLFVFLWITPLSPSLSSSPSSPKALKVKQEDGARESFKEIREPLTSLGRRWAVSKGGWKKPLKIWLKTLFKYRQKCRGALMVPWVHCFSTVFINCEGGLMAFKWPCFILFPQVLILVTLHGGDNFKFVWKALLTWVCWEMLHFNFRSFRLLVCI